MEHSSSLAWRDYFYLYGEVLTHSDVVILDEVAAASKTTQVIRLHNCTIDQEDLLFIAENIGRYNVTEVYLRKVRMAATTVIALVESIRGSKIKKVDVSLNGFGVDGGRAFARALANLEVLKISNNPIGPAVVDIANALRMPGSTLRHLDVSMTQCVDEGAFALALAIPVCNLSYLNVSRNEIRNAGIKAICDAIGNDARSMMGELYIGDNTALSGETIDAVASMIRRSKLYWLNLDMCLITKDGIRKLARAVRENHYIEYLDLEGNRDIDDDDVMSFVDVIGKHRSLKTLYLSSFDVHQYTLNRVADMLYSLHTRHAASFTMMMCARTKPQDICPTVDIIRRLRDYLDP